MSCNFGWVVTSADINRCVAVRRRVFIESQGVAEELEVDGLDDQCIHFLGVDGSKAIAAGRILPRGDTAKIQRVAVIPEYQRQGVGARIMKSMIAYARNDGFAQAILGSQVHALPFYEKLGFEPFGEIYMEAGIEHRDMRMIL